MPRSIHLASILAAAVLALLIEAPLEPARSQGPLAACADGPMEAKIAACTAAIESGKFANVLLAIAHTNQPRPLVCREQPARPRACRFHARDRHRSGEQSGLLLSRRVARRGRTP